MTQKAKDQASQGVAPSNRRHPKMSRAYEIEVNERRLDDEYDTTAPATEDRRDGQHDARTDEADPPLGGAREGGNGPYNRGGQFEETEKESDSPYADTSPGAFKKDRSDWQDEGRHSSGPAPEDRQDCGSRAKRKP